MNCNCYESIFCSPPYAAGNARELLGKDVFTTEQRKRYFGHHAATPSECAVATMTQLPGRVAAYLR